MSIIRYRDLAARIRALPPLLGPVRLVAIDGPAGSGKTTFAERLAVELPDIQVLHSDDFPVPWTDPASWWDGLNRLVLRPLAAGRVGRFQRYDWRQDAFAEWIEVPVAPVVITEGVGTAQRAAAERISMVIWVEAVREVRQARILARDGAGHAADWRAWRRAEDAFFAEDRTRDRAAILVDGSPVAAHDPSREFVMIGDC